MQRDRSSYVLRLRVTDSRFARGIAMNGNVAAHAAADATVRRRSFGELEVKSMVLGAHGVFSVALSTYRSDVT